MVFLRSRGVEYGRLPYIWGTLPRIAIRGSCRVGARFRLDGIQFQADLQVGPEGILEIGDDVFVNRGVTIYASKRVTIGNNVRIADLASIHDSDLHEVEPGRSVTREPVAIGDNVWIGRGAVILPGVQIGDHSVVGAGSVVTRSIPASTLAAGSPAQIVRPLARRDGWVRR